MSQCQGVTLTHPTVAFSVRRRGVFGTFFSLKRRIVKKRWLFLLNEHNVWLGWAMFTDANVLGEILREAWAAILARCGEIFLW